MKVSEKVTAKDITTHSQKDTERVPRVIEVNAIGVKYKVHRHIYHPGTWLLSCKDLNIDCEDMKTDDMEEAMHRARAYMIGAIDGYVACLEQSRKALEESEDISI